MGMIAYRFQARPKPAQQAMLRRFAGMSRWIWNAALAEQRARHERGERYASFPTMCKWLTVWRNDPATAWLAEGPRHMQEAALDRLDRAYRRFFEKQAGFPRFRARRPDAGLMCFDHPADLKIDRENGRAYVPKVGWLRLRMSRDMPGDLRTASVVRQGGKWFVSLVAKTADVVPAGGLAPTLGIDLGIAAFAAMSDGATVAPLRALETECRKLRRAYRDVSRKVKGSSNRRKAVDRLGRLHRRIANQRNDWLHKLSTGLADRHPVIAIEDLQVAAMSAGARGKGRAAKAGLNRSILDAGWAEFRRQLTYKTQARGGDVVAVPAAYTSRTCRLCGHESAENRKTQAVFSCVACGHTEHADIHAAKNILAAGRAAWLTKLSAAACGGEVRRQRRASAAGATPMKQEPTEAKEPT